MRPYAPLACGAALLVLTACSGGSTPSRAASTPTGAARASSPLPTCPPVKTAYAWPRQIPQDLPKLPGGKIGSVKRTADGLSIVQFTTATSLRNGVIFIVRKLPPAGYTLGRGDAEPAEADAPFTKGELRGVLRGAAIAACRTTWILAVTRQTFGTGSPLLPSHAGPSPTPLPFG